MWLVGKNGLVKSDVARDYHAAGSEVKATITLVLERIAKEYAASGARGKFVGRGGVEVGVAKTTKHGVGDRMRDDGHEEESRV